MAEYEIYRVVTVILFLLGFIILAYDLKRHMAYDDRYHSIRFIIAVILMIGAIYTAFW